MLFREILGSVLKPPFLCKCCSAIRREEVCKQVGCERERLTLYINNTNFPLINMQQLKHIIFQDLLNEPRIYSILYYVCLYSTLVRKTVKFYCALINFIYTFTVRCKFYAASLADWLLLFLPKIYIIVLQRSSLRL